MTLSFVVLVHEEFNESKMMNIARLWVSMIDRYAKFAAENLKFSASSIELVREGGNVLSLSRFCHASELKKPLTSLSVA